MKTEFLKQKRTTGILSIITFFIGYLFLDQKLTGNIILNTKYSFSLLSLIGLGLIICSLLFTYYTIKK